MITFDSSEIANWADKPDAQHLLPELIRLLILATVPMPSLLDMPSGSSVWLPGWDGLLVTERGNAWVPDGASAWEFSREQNLGSKATADYKKRTKNPQGSDRPKTMFVFVTPRKWAGKRTWATERSKEGQWSDVRALNADDLVAWLGQAPAVAHWFARLIGKLPATGVVPLDEWWENWPDGSPARRAASHCICHSAGLGKPSSIVPWPDCAPCHSLPDGGGGNRPPSGQPNVPANSRQSGLRVPLAASSPRYLALTNIRRRSQSLPAATEDRHRPPLYPKSCPDHRPPLPLSPVPLLHSHPFGGFGLKGTFLEIAPLLRRPVGRPPKKPIIWYDDFWYQAGSWDRPRRVIAKVEWHQGELFPQVGLHRHQHVGWPRGGSALLQWQRYCRAVD